MASSKLSVGVFCVALLSIACVGLSPQSEPADQPATSKVRVGTYRSRAVALAYGRSEMSNRYVSGLKAEHDKAKAAGDEVRVKELEKKGEGQQRRLHMQVFGHAPIHGILKQHLKEALAEEARSAGVDLVVRDVDIAFRTDAVELVDITAALVKRFQPSKETLKMVEDIDNHAPLPLEAFPVDCGHPNDNDTESSSRE